MVKVFLSATNAPVSLNCSGRYVYAGKLDIKEALEIIPELILQGAKDISIKLLKEPKEVRDGKGKEGS